MFAKPPSGTRSPPSAPLSSPQDATQGLQSDQCCSRSSLPGNLHWTGSRLQHTLGSLLSPQPLLSARRGPAPPPRSGSRGGSGRPGRPDPEIPGISNRAGSSRRDPEGSQDRRSRKRFSLGVGPHRTRRARGSGGSGPACRRGEFPVATGCLGADAPLPRAAGARGAREGDLGGGGGRV